MSIRNVISFAEIFHHEEPRRPLSAILREAREAKGLTIDQASSVSRLPLEEILLLEEGREMDVPMARIHAASYARALGLDPVQLRKDLPGSPDLLPRRGDYFRNISRPQRPSGSFSRSFLAPLAPLGHACLSLLLLTLILSTWGVMRQLSRVRSIPWITSNSTLSSFQVR